MLTEHYNMALKTGSVELDLTSNVTVRLLITAFKDKARSKK